MVLRLFLELKAFLLSKIEKGDRSSFFNVLASVAASMFGVQSEKNRQFDFEQNSFLPYLFVGIMFVVFFVLSLIALVSAITA